MSLEKKKLEVIAWVIEQEDQKHVQKIHKFIADIELSKKYDSMIVGYRANGVAVSKSKLIQWIEESEANISLGEFHTYEEVEKLSETW